jgi:hypothetical protein
VYTFSYFLPRISSYWGPALLASPPSAVIRLVSLLTPVGGHRKKSLTLSLLLKRGS